MKNLQQDKELRTRTQEIDEELRTRTEEQTRIQEIDEELRTRTEEQRRLEQDYHGRPTIINRRTNLNNSFSLTHVGAGPDLPKSKPSTRWIQGCLSGESSKICKTTPQNHIRLGPRFTTPKSGTALLYSMKPRML